MGHVTNIKQEWYQCTMMSGGQVILNTLVTLICIYRIIMNSLNNRFFCAAFIETMNMKCAVYPQVIL
jgi:hypothetical protein